ncbi:UNVERIFIED_CONTAM: hypothetical protein GTU68_049859 [Idotea baltica]|nr:hypothetical protein [Idotea baltica]
MPHFEYEYEALDQSGDPHVGVIQADSETEAASKLQLKGHYVTRFRSTKSLESRAIQLPYPDDPIDIERIWAEPTIAKNAWIAPGAVVIGDVTIGQHSSVWYNSVVRGDSAEIRIGDETNIQDGCVLHVDSGTPCILKDRVSLGHRAIVHASTVEEGSLIGMNATVLSRCHIGPGSLVAAGAVVPEGTQVPAGTLWAGIPARQIRPLSEDHQEMISHVYRHYANNTAVYLERSRQAQNAN